MLNDPHSELLPASRYFTPEQGPIRVLCLQDHGRVGMHAHEFMELVLIAEGATLHSFGGQTQIMTAGDFFVILPGDQHSYIDTKRTALYNCLFMPELLEQHRERLGRIPTLDFLYAADDKRQELHKVRLDVISRQRVTRLLDEMIRESQERRTGWQTEMEALFLSLLVIYARMADESRVELEENSAHYRQVMQAVEFIENNYQNNCQMEDVAAAAGLSPSYLTRQFRAYLGSTPIAYARQYRVNRAAELLLETDAPLSAIASATGYRSLSVFSRQFRQLTGQSPSVFRRVGKAARLNDPHITPG
ncbi:MAG: AraC family transcriptional regulator [Bacillota bacterium]|nr:AraC family transcriptional regulator [Bacillota bacterium]